MTEQEQEDLKKLREQCAKIRESAFSAMRDYLRMTPEQLRAAGYKTQESAAIGYFKYAEREIDKLTKAHLKKYPD